MKQSAVSITLSEWDSVGPESGNPLEGLTLGDSDSGRRLAKRLSDANVLSVTELRSGLAIQAFSFVGKVQLGDVEVTVLPKLNKKSLLNLVRYAYGLRRIDRFQESSLAVGSPGLEDLLVVQLIAEASELLSRGLHRRYVKKDAWLSSPRGRINMRELAGRAGTLATSLPCTYYPRSEDCPLNQALLAGLLLASHLAGDLGLRRETRRVASILEQGVSRVSLDREVLRKADHAMSRLTKAYEPSLKIIGLLCESQGVVLQGEASPLRLPGFLFDMNRFFQSLLGRFLTDNLDGHVLREEHRLRNMIRYEINPRNRRPPDPRPDFVVFKGAKAVAILDAKYRDLWEKSLPRDMLYQLALYASSHVSGKATILYPTYDRSASEARISVSDPVAGKRIAEVCLRPIVLDRIEQLIAAGWSASATRDRAAFAHRMVFGDKA